MSRLEKLSKHQEKLMHETKDEWLDKFFSCKNKIDIPKATEKIKWLYKVCELNEPMVIFVSSPIAAQLAANMLTKSLNIDSAQVWDQVAAQVRAQVWAQVAAQVRAQVRAQVAAQVRAQVRDQVRDQVAAQVRDQVRAQVWDQVAAQVRAQVWAQVWDQVAAQVRAQVWDMKLEHFSFSSYGNVWDYGWLSFYSFFQKIGVLKKHKGLQNMIELMDTGVYDMIQLDGLCILCELPSEINRSWENNKLHCEDGYAIKWNDGYNLHYWNGMCVDKKWIESPELITRETVINERNAEKRRCIQEILGAERYAQVLGGVEIDKDQDQYKNDMILYRTKDKDELAEDYIYFARVVCPSSDRVYFLCVPEMYNVWEAVAWTFGKKKEDYQLDIQT